MTSVWRHLPIVVRAVIAGLLVAAVGVIPWSGIAGYPALAAWNLRAFVSVPWAIVPMSLLLGLFWWYLNGGGWPSTTASSRRTSLRANRLPADVWGMAILAGMLGLASLLPLLRLMSRFVELPAESQPITIPPGMPFVTAFFLLVMASIVAGVAEEAAYRGYMQGPIERRHGPIVAILISGTVFGLAHYNHHPDSILPTLPYYIAVSAVYG